MAQDAARAFVEDQVAGTRIGIVAFAGFAELIVPPTTDKGELTEAIDNLTTSRGTVIGAATLKSLDAIAAVNPDVRPIGSDLAADVSRCQRQMRSATASGDYVPDIIVLLTDGANTRGHRPRRRRAAGRRPARAHLHHRLRHHEPDRDGLHARAARRRRVRRGWVRRRTATARRRPPPVRC